MELKELLRGVEVLETTASENLDIAGVAYDSRKVTAGGLFVAVSGFQTDGTDSFPWRWKRVPLRWSRPKAGGDVPHSRPLGPAGPGPHRGQLLLPSGGANDHDRRHRHQRQDLRDITF